MSTTKYIAARKILYPDMAVSLIVTTPAAAVQHAAPNTQPIDGWLRAS